MAAYWRLNGYYDPIKGKGLYEAISERKSCRSFLSAPTAEQWDELKALAEDFALPGVRMELGLCDNAFFSPFFGLLMKFENVQRFAAIITTDDEAESVVNAGISGEMLMLAAVRAGLGGCWVAGTYKRGEAGSVLREGEKLRAVIALGVPQEKPTLPIARKRKALSDICRGDFASAPPVMDDVARAVQAAPSAVNLQPWRLTYTTENELSISVGRPMQRLDFGIAVCHAMLAVGNRSVQYTLAEDGLSARLELS